MSGMRDAAEDARLARAYAERVAQQDAERPGYAALWATLCQRLLAHGGDHVVPPLEPDHLIGIWVALQPGIVERPTRAVPGSPSDCHRNVARLWQSGDAIGIGTGYALSDDGLWREHSWAVDAGGFLLETTEPRLAYFGGEWSGDEAAWFAEGQLDA